jgi:hypothetical protein
MHIVGSMSTSARRIVLLALIGLALIVSAILSTSASARDEAQSISSSAALR